MGYLGGTWWWGESSKHNIPHVMVDWWYQKKKKKKPNKPNSSQIKKKKGIIFRFYIMGPRICQCKELRNASTPATLPPIPPVCPSTPKHQHLHTHITPFSPHNLTPIFIQHLYPQTPHIPIYPKIHNSGVCSTSPWGKDGPFSNFDRIIFYPYGKDKIRSLLCFIYEAES